MILLYVLSTIIPLCYGQNANLTFEVLCDTAEDTTLTVDAVYTGTGTPSLVTWTYSGSSLSIDTSGCTAINTLPAVFPDSSRLSYKCVTIDASLPANTYQLLVAKLQADEFGKIWAVTFTPPSAAAPAAVQATVPSGCPSTTPPPTSSTTPPPTSHTTVPQTSSTTPPSTTTNSPDIVIIVISVSGGMVVLISIIVCIWLRRKTNRKKNNKDVQDTKNAKEMS